MRFAALSTSLVALAGCKLSVNDLVKRPGTGDASGAPTASSSPATATRASNDAGHGRDRGDERATDLTADIVVVAAADGVPVIGPSRPGWCDLPALREQAGELPNYTASLLQQALTEESRWELYAIQAAQAACATPDGKQMAVQTGHLLQLWANHTGQTADELVAYIGFAASRTWEAQQQAQCATLRVSDEASTRTKLFAQATASVYGCGSPSKELDWELDRTAAPPSELLRAYQVRRCLDTAEPRPDQIFQYSVCGHDARGLDRKALDKELAGQSEWAKAVARRYHAEARLQAARYERAARALAAQDPVWQQLLFDVPARAWKDWEASYQGNRAAIDAAFAYEDVHDGPSKQAARGCLDGAWAALAAQVASAHAGDLHGAKQALMTPVGNLLVRHVALCLDAEGDILGKGLFSEVLTTTPTGRGPRHAMSAAVLDALVTVKSDRTKFPAEPSWFRRYVAGGTRELLNRDLTSIGGGKYDAGGIIQSVTRSGGELRVEFKPDKHRERETWCEDTSKIIGWFGDGRPQYEQRCGTGGMITVDLTHQPMLVAPVFGAALKPGRFVRWKQDTEFPGEGNTAHGIPVEIWSDADRTKLIGYLGLAL